MLLGVYLVRDDGLDQLLGLRVDDQELKGFLIPGNVLEEADLETA